MVGNYVVQTPRDFGRHLLLISRTSPSFGRLEGGAAIPRRRILLTSRSRAAILWTRCPPAVHGECFKTLTFLSYMRLASAGYFSRNSGPPSPRYQKWWNLTRGPRLLARLGSLRIFSGPIP